MSGSLISFLPRGPSLNEFDRTDLVWMNGAIIAWGDATTHVSSHALHYGSGVFDGVRCYETASGPAIFRLDAHVERLFRSATLFGIKIPYSVAEVKEAICKTIVANGFDDCYIRPICYYGSGSLGLKPNGCPVNVAILAWPWPAYLDQDGSGSGVRLTVSPFVKFHSRIAPTTAKICGAYINPMLAASEAASRGYDEALLLDEQGFVAEGSVENIFIVRNRALTTNCEESSILPGITRQAVMSIAGDLGYEVGISRITVKDIVSADEAFLTGTAAEIAPIREVDGQRIGEAGPGAVTGSIQHAFAEAVRGRDRKYQGWLYPVRKAASA